MFFCLRDLAGVAAFPDHVILAPGEQIDGELCWTRTVAGAYQKPADATIVYGAPDVFSTVVHPGDAFMGVFLPPH
jgi:hypothetical protein